MQTQTVYVLFITSSYQLFTLEFCQAQSGSSFSLILDMVDTSRNFQLITVSLAAAIGGGAKRGPGTG